MRNLVKLPKPDILISNEGIWLDEYVADKGNKTKRYRYRHSDIKGRLEEETGWKCVYCESKVGHNTPGDIEHKIPTSKKEHLHFSWENMTVACTECNRRKRDYYRDEEMFLDPYADDVESLLVHLGPIVSWISGAARAEMSVKILELHNENRAQLISRKIEKIEEISHLIERFTKEENSMLKAILKMEIKKTIDKQSEYSAMVISVLANKRIVIGE